MKRRLIIGIIDIIVGLALFIACLILNRTERIMLTLFPVAVGLGTIAGYISEKRDRKRRMAELAKKWGIKDELY